MNNNVRTELAWKNHWKKVKIWSNKQAFDANKKGNAT